MEPGCEAQPAIRTAPAARTTDRKTLVLAMRVTSGMRRPVSDGEDLVPELDFVKIAVTYQRGTENSLWRSTAKGRSMTDRGALRSVRRQSAPRPSPGASRRSSAL